jgi:hypothetical protein
MANVTSILVQNYKHTHTHTHTKRLRHSRAFREHLVLMCSKFATYEWLSLAHFPSLSPGVGNLCLSPCGTSHILHICSQKCLLRISNVSRNAVVSKLDNSCFYEADSLRLEGEDVKLRNLFVRVP